MAENRKKVAVVIVPFPMQGHMTPLLRLSHRIAAAGVPIHYVGSAATVRQATARSDGCDPSAAANLHFHGFPTPQFENLPPSENYPTHLGPMIWATLSGFPDPLSSLVNKLGSENYRVVVIFDALMASTVKSVHSSPIVESYVFESTSSFTIYAAYWEAIGKPEIRPEADVMMRELPSTEGCFTSEFKQFVDLQYRLRDFHSGTIFNTSRVTEGLYLDLLANLQLFGSKRIWALGPLNPIFEREKSDSKCLKWLDKQPKNSVVFVSFGTASSLSGEQIEELALGLERSEVRFVWLLRDADRGDIFAGGEKRAELPQGFEERVRERGIVVREWEPQLEILEHCAVGGFLSHCGWNSCMESISLGVPMVAWPMHSDQPRNTVLITKVLKIGVEVRDWARRDELVCSVEVEKAVKRLMASAEGGEMRQRAEKIADLVKKSVMKDGAARVEMDSFIAHITRKD